MQADKNRTERSFSVGTWVYVKLQPYVQTSVAARANQKLSFRFFGPYVITEKIGSVAYKLQLPPSSTVHLIFHVSQLKGAVPVSHSAEPLPNSLDGLQVPERILQKRMATVGTAVRLQALIQWSGLPSSLATWEDLEHLRQRFPRAPAWGQACSDLGGCQQHKAVDVRKRRGRRRPRQYRSWAKMEICSRQYRSWAKMLVEQAVSVVCVYIRQHMQRMHTHELVHTSISRLRCARHHRM
jgi:hypothetical protein